MMDTLEQKAHEMANGMGISVWIRDGRIWQHGPGQEIRPPVNAKPVPHGVDGLNGDTPAAP